MRGVLGVTMFDRIMQKHGRTAAHMLDTQYRMNEQIMQWSSNELYHGDLKAHSSVAQHTLSDLNAFSADNCSSEPPVDVTADDNYTEGEVASRAGVVVALGCAVLALIDTAGCDMNESEEDGEGGGVSGNVKGGARQRGSKYNEGEAQLVVEHVDVSCLCWLLIFRLAEVVAVVCFLFV
jgi:superfamily I DNA and/or RNA helicase